jgi:hypothetical protein
MNPNKENHRSELDWTAFCYATGELCAAEGEAFELRLAGDQLAREALAQAVELVQVVAAAESQASDFVRPVIAHRENSNSGFSFSWLAVGGVAAVLLAIVCGVVGQTWQTAEHSRRSAMKAQLASAWYETRTKIANEKETGLWPAVGAISTEIDDDMTPGVAADDYGDYEGDEAPSWLNVAVILANDRAADSAANPSADPNLEN